jgi:hypothetical protein
MFVGTNLKQKEEKMITEYDETPKDAMLIRYQGLMKSDLRRLLTQIYRLSEIISHAMITENYYEKLPESDKSTGRTMVECALSAWSKLSTLRMRVDAPLQQADHLDIWELLNDLREYAHSTFMAFLPVVGENPYNAPLPEEMDKRVVYNATEYFDIYERLLREDVEVIDRLLRRIVSPVDTPIALKKSHRSA